MSKILNLGLRGLQFFWTLLIIALVGNMIHDAIGGNPSIVNYCMFVAVFAMLSLIYLVPVTFMENSFVHDAAPLALDGLNTLFFLIGGIALAAYLGVHSCGDGAYVDSNVVTSGSYDNTKRCHEGQAVCAFLWFGFAAFLGTLIFQGLSKSGGSSIGGSRLRRGPPAMSQV